MSYDSLAMEPPGALSQEGYDRGPDIVAFRATAAHWARLAALAALYVLAGKLGLHFAFVHASATAVWPPTGIALAAFLLFGPRVWPAVAVGAFLVNVTTAGSVTTSLGVAAGNTLEGLLSAWLVNRFAHGRYAFERAQDIFILLRWNDLRRAKRFAKSADLRKTMKAAGVRGKPDVFFLQESGRTTK